MYAYDSIGGVMASLGCQTFFHINGAESCLEGVSLKLVDGVEGMMPFDSNMILGGRRLLSDLSLHNLDGIFESST